MSIHHSIIRYPSITERNTILRSSRNSYVFDVAPSSTKTEIRAAVEHLFNVRVISVNTMVVKGKKKRHGRFVGHRPNWKKAIVKIAEGQSIDKFGEV